MLRRSARLSTRQSEESESTVPIASSPAGQAGDSSNPPPVDNADTTAQDEVTTTTKALKRKRRTNKEADASSNPNTRPQDDDENDEKESTACGGSSETSAKKEAHPKKKNKKTISPTVAQTSSVSKAWLDGSRTSPTWKTICETGELGKPKLKYKSYMALACANSFWTCDECFSVTKGRPRGSHIPLPMSFSAPFAEDSGTNESESNIWMLCFECRRKHYDDTPEALHADAIGDEHIYHEDTTQMVAKTGACKTYSLTEEDLKGLDYVVRPNPHHYNGLPMRLFERDQVQRLALRTHAGWVGINAVRNGVARSRLTHFNQRVKEVQAGSRAQSSQ
ncbi:hypothetical protein BGZ47_000857 [Haplosporangium gracile]|nr:hypothetical protein BGZ47_000857 [Haplosporangium gracile]